MSTLLRLGVDVGGTNTDAVLIEARSSRVISACKTYTTVEPFHGILEAAAACISAAEVEPSRIHLASLGTTSFLNAVVQRRGLAKVALLRLGAPATTSLPPFVDFSQELCAALQAKHQVLEGGFEYDGAQEISPLNEEKCRECIRGFLRNGYRSFVVVGVNSPVNSSQEETVGSWLAEESAAGAAEDEVHITLSHKIAGLGLLERENASALNAALRPLASRIVPAFQTALEALSITCAKVYFAGNDGCLLSAERAREMPLLCFQSAVVNSLRGAAFLSGVRNGLVLDIGGTSSDIGVLVNGMARSAAATALMAGQVRTNFPLPDVVSIGLGGGSLVRSAENGSVNVGPVSVGHELPVRSIAGGGNQLTATDIAVALGKVNFGDKQKVAAYLGRGQDGLAERAWAIAQGKLEVALDSMKTSADPVPLIVVGGGSALCGDALAGVSNIIKPAFAEVANAIGAAIPQVGGSVDAVFKYGSSGEHRQAVLEEAKASATSQAVAEGAVPESCEVVTQEEMPLAYLPGGVTRVIVKVVGALAQPEEDGLAEAGEQQPPAQIVWAGAAAGLGKGPLTSCSEPRYSSPAKDGQYVQDSTPQEAGITAQESDNHDVSWSQDPSKWRPDVNSAGEWLVGVDDVHALAIGCGVLGTGGGGSPHKAKLKLLQELKRGGQIKIISPAAIPDHGLIAEAGYMGAPTVSIEKLDSNSAKSALLAACAADPEKRTLVAIIPAEIGGGNGLEPLLIGSQLGLSVCDADQMGRAFPELQMVTPAIYGLPLTPAALADEKDNTVLVQGIANPDWLERILRPVCTSMGCSAGLATAPISGADLRRVGILYSMSLAYRIGRAVLAANFHKQDPVAAATKEGQGKLIFQGKVVDLQRKTSEGFARGSVKIGGLAAFQNEGLVIDFQNENLVAKQQGSAIAVVPDLICVLDTQSGRPIQTEDMRYGLRVSVVLFPAPSLLRTPEALAVVGPKAFGLEGIQYKPALDPFQPMSVNAEYQRTL